MQEARAAYPSDLTDEQWAEMEPLFSGMREYAWPKREPADTARALLKQVAGGETCRMIFRHIRQYTASIGAPESMDYGKIRHHIH